MSGGSIMKNDDNFRQSVTFILRTLSPHDDQLEERVEQVIDTFGTFANFIVATELELSNFGFNQNEIMFIKSIPYAAELYCGVMNIKIVNDCTDATDLLLGLAYRDRYWEAIVALDDNNKVIKVEKLVHLNCGGGNKISYKKICSICLNAHYNRIIYVHNDFGGEDHIGPNYDDDFEELDSILGGMNIELVDAIIISPKRSWSMRECIYGVSYYPTWK